MFAKYSRFIMFGLFAMLSLVACQQEEPAQEQHAMTEGSMDHTAEVVFVQGNTETPPLPIVLDATQTEEIGSVYEAYLAPHQEPGEEKDTPSHIPSQFRSTTPSTLREDRLGRGHAWVRFTKDLSRAYIDIDLENINHEEVVMFHIHCGRPDMLGPIIVDFSLIDDIQANMADGVYSIEITNAVIEATAASGEGVVGSLTMGCPIPASLALELGSIDRVKTIAGMEFIARQGELYFNLHTSGHVYFGDIRGQIYRVEGGE